MTPPAKINERALAMLNRFPRHLELARADKVAYEVVDALAEGLEVQTTQVGRVRRAHRLRYADEERDLALLALSHDLRSDHVALLPMRRAAIAAAAAVLRDVAPADPQVATARAALNQLVGAPISTFTAWPTEGSNPQPAQARLATALRDAVAYPAELELLRERLITTIALHREGNGTIGALLGAAANALDLDIERVRHHAQGYWHLAHCRDRFQLTRPEPPGAPVPTVEVQSAEDMVALEENPFVHKEIEPFPCTDAALFALDHAGLEPSPLNIHVVGVEDHTVYPMIVQRDVGLGFAFHGSVPDGKHLIFGRDGTVTLDGTDVTGHAWAFEGGVFAAEGENHAADFRFTDDAGAAPSGQPAVFAEAVPYADAFNPSATWPHAAGDVPSAIFALGRSRWGFFVRSAHFGSIDDTTTPAPDVFAVSFWQAGVFGTDTMPESVWCGPPTWTAAEVGFDWDEREAFAVKVWLPMRFQFLDDTATPPAYPPVRERVRAVLDRHRAAGIHVYVDYASDLWTLGEGILRDLESEEPEGIVINGTRTWPDAPS